MVEAQAKPDRDRHPARVVAVQALAAALLVVSFAGTATATTIEKWIAASADDAEEAANSKTKANSNDLELIHDTSDQTVGMRWIALGIPRGTTITAAYIQFGAKESQSEVTSLTLRGQAADNAPAFGPGTGNTSTRAGTAAAASLTPVA